MTRPSDIIDYVQARTGHTVNPDEGLQYGAGERFVKGVTVAWMATPDAIQAAAESGDELLIAHERLYYPYDVTNVVNPPAD